MACSRRPGAWPSRLSGASTRFSLAERRHHDARLKKEETGPRRTRPPRESAPEPSNSSGLPSEPAHCWRRFISILPYRTGFWNLLRFPALTPIPRFSPFQPHTATKTLSVVPTDDSSTPDCATGLISRRDFTDVTGRPVHVLVLGAYDAGVRRAWVHRNLAQALARLSADAGSDGGSAIGVPERLRSHRSRPRARLYPWFG